MNKLIIIGNCTRDAELRTTQTGFSVCTFTVAVNNRKKKDNNGKDDAQFFKVTAWRGLAENCAKFVTKGMKVCVVGPVALPTYTNDKGETHYNLEVTADDVEFLSRSESAPQANVPAQQEPEVNQGYTDVSGVVDDELPF